MLECKQVKDNDDGTKQYMVQSNADVDLRKQLFDVLPKNDITIFELKKAEKSLEDAFLTLVDTNTKEIDRKQKEQAEKQIEEKKKSQEKKKENKKGKVKAEEKVTPKKAKNKKGENK